MNQANLSNNSSSNSLEELLQEQLYPPGVPQPPPVPKKPKQKRQFAARQKGASTSTGNFLPSLSVQTGKVGRPASRYIPPGDKNSPSSSFLLPPLSEIVIDLDICAGNIQTFLEAACTKKSLHERLMYDVVQALKEDPGVYREFQQKIATSQESRKIKQQELAFIAIEKMLLTGKASPQILQLVLKEQPAPPPVPAAMPAPTTAAAKPSDPVSSFLDEDDSPDDDA